MADFNLLSTSPHSLKANATVSINRFCKLDLTGAKLTIQCAAGTDISVGVATKSAVAGESVELQTIGIAKLAAGAAIAIGAQVTANASGQAVTVAAGNISHGMALQAAGAAGDVIEVLLTPLPNLNGPVN
jgi:hypothetical protein